MPPSAAEKEILQILAPHDPQARLAYQIPITVPMAIADYAAWAIQRIIACNCRRPH